MSLSIKDLQALGVRRIQGCFLGLSLALVTFIPVWGEVDGETRRRMIDEFEATNRAAHRLKVAIPVSDTPTQEGGFEPLKQALAEARLRLLEDRSEATKAAVAQATINFVDPLMRLEHYNEAASAIKLSLRAIGAEDLLGKRLADCTLAESKRVLEAGDWEAAKRLLEKGLRETRTARVKSAEELIARSLKDLLLDDAARHFREGDWDKSRKQALEALTLRVGQPPIRALLAALSFQRDDYKEALKQNAIALQGKYHRDPLYLGFGELIRKEYELERSYRKHVGKDLVLTRPASFSVNEHQWESAFGKARRAASRVFGLSCASPIRVSFYQRSDYFRFTGAPDWSGVVSQGSKVRLRADAGRGGAKGAEVIARYATALWLIDLRSGGRAPAWLKEGVAHQLAYPAGPPNGAIHELKSRLGRGKILPFKDIEKELVGIRDWEDAAVVMAQSQMAVQLLAEKHGLECFPAILQALATEERAEMALLEVTGFNYDDLFAAWSEKMKEHFLTNEFPDIPTLRALGRASPLGAYWEE